MARVLSSMLPFASVLVIILIVLNILAGIAMAALVLVLPSREWIVAALDLGKSEHTETIVWGLRAVAALGIVSVAFNHLILSRLSDILKSVGAGDPFVSENAYRLQAIAWFMLSLQIVGLVIAAVGRYLSAFNDRVDLGAGLSPAGWLAVLLTFVLARVFAEGTLMRRDLEGTV